MKRPKIEDYDRYGLKEFVTIEFMVANESYIEYLESQNKDCQFPNCGEERYEKIEAENKTSRTALIIIKSLLDGDEMIDGRLLRSIINKALEQ